MARADSKAALKKPDPHRAEEWPVSKYPYMVTKPNEEFPVYRASHKDALNWLKKDVRKFQVQFQDLDREAANCCDLIVSRIGILSEDGGSIDMMIMPYHEIRYRARLVRRKEVR